MPYAYIEHVLTGNERVIFLGEFPWIYKVHAFFYLLFGIIASIAVLLIGIAFDSGRPLSPDIFRQLGPIIDGKGGFLSAMRDVHMGVRIFSFLCLLVGVGIFSSMLIAMLTTEIGITSYRLIYKTGLIARNVGEMNLNRVESVHVRQSIIGRIFNYGAVDVRGMGIGDISLPVLQDPLALRRAIEVATRDRTDNERRP